jgi:hypothetical protein
MNTPPLRPFTTLPAWPARLGVEHGAGAARLGLDDRAACGRADLLVRGEQPDQRRRRAAELLEGGEHEGVHHQPGLHIGDARAIGVAVLYSERPARRLAFRKHRVAMAHQHDGAVGWTADGRAQRIAELFVRDRLAGDPLLFQNARSRSPTASTPAFVVGAAVDIHDVLEQGEHRAFWPPSHSTTAFSPCTPDIMNSS